LSTVARTVQLINFEFDGNTYKALRRRETDDLPNGVVGTAHWRHLGKGHRNTGYYLVQGDDEKPIEFLNNQWFEIFWHENNWYTAADASIPIENDLGLGWWSTEDQEYVLRQQASGFITLGEQETSAEPSSRATEYAGPSSRAQDTAGPSSSTAETGPSSFAQEPRQGRLAALGIAPLATGTQQSETMDPSAPAQIAAANLGGVQQQQAPRESNGRLDGTPPAWFQGDRSTSEIFLREFRIYRNLNPEAPVMKNPYQRVNLALSRIRGSKVNEWVDEQLRALDAKTTGRNAMARTDEVLWTEFETDFRRAYTNSTEQLDAHQSIKRLKMNGEDLDTYVAMFKTLARKANYDLDAIGTLDIFQEGLPRRLWEKIIGRDTTPDTFNEWVSAAQKEQQKFLVLKGKGMGGTGTYNLRRDGWRRILWGNQPRHQQRRQSDGVVPMDVDVAEVTVVEDSGTSGTEYIRALTCYNCNQEGHYAKECPRGNAGCYNCGRRGHNARDCRSPRNFGTGAGNRSGTPGTFGTRTRGAGTRFGTSRGPTGTSGNHTGTPQNAQRPSAHARLMDLRGLQDEEKEDLMEAALAEDAEGKKGF
jgi:hypothetical protein